MRRGFFKEWFKGRWFSDAERDMYFFCFGCEKMYRLQEVKRCEKEGMK